MEEKIVEKWNFINDWYKENYEKVYRPNYYTGNIFNGNAFNKPANEKELLEIADMLGTNIPAELKTLLTTHNGEIGEANSPFFELRFLDVKEMKAEIAFALSLKKSANRYINDQAKTDQLVKQIIEEVQSKLTLSNWHKITFQGGDVFGMPVVFKNKNDLTEKENLRIDHQKANALINQLKLAEKETYAWDDIKFTLINGEPVQLERMETDWNYGISSFPEKTVKPVYFHFQWIPIFSDSAGNYIGLDMDPEEKGIAGQVILYGRDITENRKLADNIEDLFDKIIQDIEKGSAGTIIQNPGIHIHERLKLL